MVMWSDFIYTVVWVILSKNKKKLHFFFYIRYPPFNGYNDTNIIEKVKIAKYNFDKEEWNYISEEAKNFIRKLLEKDTKKRYSALESLGDPWILKNSLSESCELPLL